MFLFYHLHHFIIFIEYEYLYCSIYSFFVQAEDGIRDRTVTGVQTCALPISGTHARRQRPHPWGKRTTLPGRTRLPWTWLTGHLAGLTGTRLSGLTGAHLARLPRPRLAGSHLTRLARTCLPGLARARFAGLTRTCLARLPACRSRLPRLTGPGLPRLAG